MNFYGEYKGTLALVFTAVKVVAMAAGGATVGEISSLRFGNPVAAF